MPARIRKSLFLVNTKGGLGLVVMLVEDRLDTGALQRIPDSTSLFCFILGLMVSVLGVQTSVKKFVWLIT